MSQNQPVSMIEPSRPMAPGVQNMYRAPVKKPINKVLIAVIVVSVIILAVLAISLLAFANGQKSVAQYGVDYRTKYKCAIDQYEYLNENTELVIEINKDKTYRLGLMDDEYSTGTWRGAGVTRARSQDGANEVNYHLILRHEKDYIEDVEVTEEDGYENKYIFNFNENSDIVVVTNENSESVYYCKIES